MRAGARDGGGGGADALLDVPSTGAAAAAGTGTATATGSAGVDVADGDAATGVATATATGADVADPGCTPATLGATPPAKSRGVIGAAHAGVAGTEVCVCSRSSIISRWRSLQILATSAPTEPSVVCELPPRSGAAPPRGDALCAAEAVTRLASDEAAASLVAASVVVLVALLLPDAAPLLGMFCFGNLMKESGVVSRLVDTTTNALINTVTILLGLAVGAKLGAEQFLVPETLGILVLGLAAFVIGTGTGVLMAHVMNRFSKIPINPIIGAAGVSAVPMAARVANRVGLEANPQNHLLMHAMGPNVAGVIGSAVAAGVLLNLAG